MKFFVINFFVLLFLTTGVNASTNSNGNNKFITKDIFVESLNLETFDNFLTSIESFETPKSNFFKIPNENNINKIKSQFLFNNGFNTLDLLLRFKMVSAEQPEYLFEIYQVALNKTKNLNYIKDEENILTSDELLINYFAEELINIFGLKEEHVNQVNLIGNSSDITTCMGDENCEEPTEAEKLFKLLPATGFIYGASLSDFAPILKGTTKTYDASLATTWSARQEYKNISLDRDIASPTASVTAIEAGTGSQMVNNYDQLNLNKAYAYGLSGAGVTINILDADLCASSPELTGKSITTFGSYTTSSASSNHGCHVITAALGNYDGNSSSTQTWSGTYDLMDYSMMGVAYNAALHFADFDGDDTVCNGSSDTDCWGPQHWELALEDAKAKGAKVSSHSWGFSPDGAISTAQLQVYATANSLNNYEALVAHQAIKTNGTYTDVGLLTSTATWTTTDWQEYVSAINEFQETGVFINAMSNDNLGTYSTVFGGTTNRNDISSGLAVLFPELQEAWINVANVGKTEDGTRALISSACADTAAFCLSHDGVETWANTYVSGGTYYYDSKTGTSMATPQIAGTIAILWEAFPDNTPETITKRLLLTADNSWFSSNTCFLDSNGDNDYSASGDTWTDYCGGTTGSVNYKGIIHHYNTLYGHGSADLYAALQPIGKKQLVDNRERAYPVIGSLLLTSLVFGDAMSLSGEQALYRDQLDGGFNFNLSSIVGTHQSRDTLKRRLFGNDEHIWSGTFNNQGLNFATSYQNDQDQNSLSDDHKLYMSFKSGRQSIFVGQKYSIEQMLGLQNGNTTSSILNRSTSNNSILSLTEASENGQVIGSEFDLNNRLSFIVAAYNGEHKTTDLNERGFLANLKHKSNSNNISLFFGQNIESDSILRSSGAGAFGSFSGKTYHAGVSFDKKISNNVYIAGLFDYGVVTESTSDGLFLDNISNLETSQFNLGIVIPNVLSKNDFATLKISQPLRTESGTSRLNLPGLRDASGKISMTSKNINLEPSGRELNFDVGYEKILSSQSTFKLGTQLSFSPNHSKSNGNAKMLYSTYSINF